MKKFLICIILLCAGKFLKNVQADTGESEEFEICQPDGFDRCTSDNDCCSEFCDKDKNEELGVCAPICGRSAIKYNHTEELYRDHPQYGEFPWHAGIYKYNDTSGTYYHLCGGTLISQKVVISAAHCVSSPKSGFRAIIVTEYSTLKVALGKYYRSFDAPDDTTAQISDVENIEIPPEYLAGQKIYDYNIAFVTLKTRVEYTTTVRPVCVDIGQRNFENKQLVKGAVGKTAGWGLIVGKNTPSETLKVVKMPFVPILECRRNISRGLLPFVNTDVLCAGDQHSNETICAGDGGGGLVFEDARTKTYILRGIVSLGSIGCKGNDFAIFTKLSSYKNLVEKYVDDCKEGCRPSSCDPLISGKLHITCSTPEGKSAKCDQPLSSNSIAIFSCHPATYMRVKEEAYNRITCTDGEWDRPLIDDFCIPAFAECGKPVSNSAQPAIINGNETKYGDFPWHAAIYEYDSKMYDYSQTCGGTLISHTVVVSAAHCFATLNNREFEMKNLSTIKVALGKFYRTFNTSGDTSAQIFDVERIEIPPYYLDHKGLFEYDIAFVTLKTKAEFTRAVIPICIDIGPDSFEDKQLISGAVGKVVGWGFTENKEPSETLKLAEMPFVPRNECLKDIHNNLLSFLRIDKICVGDKSSNVTVCGGDSGGGLVFYDEGKKSYYLRGIVSLGYKCMAIERTLFTKLSSYKELLRKHLLLESK